YTGKRLAARRAAEMREQDKRPPVLFLRSFADDAMPLKKMSLWTRFLLSRYFVWDYTSFEETLVRVFSPCGAVVAIGRPGEVLPPLGAAREWLSNQHWQQRVAELCRACRLIVMVVGEIKGADGLAWEVQQLLELGVLQKVVFVVPPLSGA